MKQNLRINSTPANFINFFLQLSLEFFLKLYLQ